MAGSGGDMRRFSLAVLALRGSAGPFSVPGRRISADLHLVDRDLRLGLRLRWHCFHHRATATDYASNRSQSQHRRGQRGTILCPGGRTAVACRLLASRLPSGHETCPEVVLVSRSVKTFLFGAVILYLAIPMIAVLLYSVSGRWTSHMLPDYYTLDHWRESLTDQRLLSALWRSTWMAFAVLLLDIA